MIECLEFNARTRLRFVNIAAIVAIGRVACERGTKESMRRCVLPPLRLNTLPLVLLVKQIIDAPRPINNIIVLLMLHCNEILVEQSYHLGRSRLVGVQFILNVHATHPLVPDGHATNTKRKTVSHFEAGFGFGLLLGAFLFSGRGVVDGLVEADGTHGCVMKDIPK